MLRRLLKRWERVVLALRTAGCRRPIWREYAYGGKRVRRPQGVHEVEKFDGRVDRGREALLQEGE